MEQEVIEGYRLSPQQEYLWLLCQQDGAAYRTQCALRIEGELHKSLLKEALQQVVEQHEILRTAFRGMLGMNLPLQVILEHGAWSWREVDLQGFAETERSAHLAALQRNESEREFNHEQGEVLYACLVMLAPDRHVLLLNISPMCADSWSLQNLVRELGRRYTARLSGEEVALEAVQYADFSEWQHNLLNAEGAEGTDFWRKQQVSDMPVLKLPLENSPGAAYRPAYVMLKSNGELVDQLESLADAYDVPLSELLLSAWSSLLWRLTGEREFVIGAAVDGERYKELRESLGLFNKYLPVHFRFAATSSFQEVIKRVAASYRDSCRRQEYYTPGESRAAEEGMGYEYEEREETIAGYGPLRVEVIGEESCRSRQRVLLQCRYQRAAKRLELRLRYDAGSYSAAVIKLLAERMETWLQSVVRAPRAELSRVTLLGEVERGLLREWGTGAALERTEAYETLGEMLEQQARQQGETAAVVGVDEVLTFSDLNARANQFGRYLRKRGVGPDAVVAILLERSTRMVECVCGVWKAGGAYLPLHPGTPPARLAQVLKQAGVRLVVSERELAGLVAGTGVEVLEWEANHHAVSAEEASAPEVAVSGENLAYVIYTSGSTGEPKGVMIEQRSVLHLLSGLRQEVYGENDERCVRVGMNAPFSFDASVKQLVQVLRGKTLVVIPEELRLEAGPLLSYLAARAVDVLDCTPAQLRLLRAEAGAEAQWPRLLLVGGEAIDGELWQQLDSWAETESINLYGPTEATVDTTWKRVTGPGVTIGRPLPQVRVYLLDQHGEQVAIGQVGEVYIGGAGVGRGYRQAAGLTADRFVPDGYGDEIGGRLYRTGDVARYREDGELEYVGRTDRQVKLRGFRIELEEVEAALLDHEGVKAAAAVVRRDEDKEERLVAYVVPKVQPSYSLYGTRSARESLSEAEPAVHTAKLEEQVVNGSALYQLPNKLEVFHHNRNETESLYHQIFENQFYLKHGISIKPGDCIFDVGANIGLFTLFVYHQVRNASVYSFEPIPSNFEKLRDNVALYGLDVNLFNCGLSDRERTATFTFYPNWSACSGVYANVEEEEETLKTFLINQGELVAEYVDELIEGRYEGEQVVCQLRTLSEVIRQHNIERIDLLKLDVEKSEWDVLAGIEAEDWKKIRQVVVEVHDLEGRLERMQQLLTEQGFVVEVEQEAGLVGTKIYSLYARRREVEAAAAELSEVRNGNGTSRLWRESIGLGAAAAEVSEAELRSYLRERLPEYMVPQVLVKLERMPLSRHGKIDYQRLPAPAPLAGELKGEAARSEVEEILAEIWSEVLGLAHVGREKNFFELGGHSLLATQVISRVREAFGVEMRLRELFERPTVKELGQSIEREWRQGAGVAALPITSVDRDRELPLSFAQQRLWFIDQLEPGGSLYNVPAAFKLTGALDVEALERSLTEIVRRHEVLRTSFGSEEGRPVQVIHTAAPVQLPLIELSHLGVEEREEQVRGLAQAEAAQAFDLSQGPLWRGQLLRLSESEHVILFTMHHIVSDGWSIAVLIKEVVALYSAFSGGESSPLEELSIQYVDYAVWQREYLQGERLEEQLGYWRRQLEAAPTVLNLPLDHQRPALQGYSGASHPFSLSPAMTESLKALSRRQGATLYMTLVAAFSHLLQRYTQAEEMLIGAPIAGRNHGESEPLIGFFVNTLVLRVDLSADPSFGELLGRVRRVCLEAYAHQEVPFEKLVEELQPERSLSHTPFFQVMFGLRNTPQEELELPGLSLTPIEIRHEVAQFDLVLDLGESDSGIEGYFEYNSHVFERATIERLASHLQRLLEGIVAEPEQRLSTLGLLTAEEEAQQLQVWNPSCGTYPREQCLQHLFEAQVARTPEAPALECNEETLSYEELNRRANQLAHHLRELGVGPETVVGILLERSVAMMCSVLAVLKAGGAYLPLDVSLPAERLSFMVRDAGAKVVISQGRFAGAMPVAEAQVVLVDEVWQFAESRRNPEVELSGDSLAYVLYTSGSTGQPKATLIPHSAIVSSNWAVIERYGLGPTDRVLQFASLSFDVSVEEIFPTWLSGGCVVLRPAGLLESHAYGWDFLRRARISVVNLPGIYWNELITARRQSEAGNGADHGTGALSLRLVAIGEEQVERFALTQEIVGPDVRLCNVYGLTETTVTTLTQDFGALASGARSVPLGKPLANSQVYVLDQRQCLLPVGVSGEIYIGGHGLARGYLQRPALTAERFVPHPFSAQGGERLYRTGDVGRWLPDGSVEFLGRVDHQIKLRGFRVELGEIEAVLVQHPAVREVVVVVQTANHDERLVAYVVGEESVASGELRQYLKGRLPEYMVPQVWVQLERLPLTANGKVDRRALAAVEHVREETEIVEAQTPVEEVLAGIWSEVLGVVQIGREENFFELGGHSLLATQVMSRVREAFGVEVALRELFERPTVKELGQSIERELRQGAVSAPPIERRERVGELPLSFAQQRLWFIDQLGPGGTVYNLPLAVRLSGVLNVLALEQTLNEIIKRHEVLRTSFAVVDEQPVQVIAAAMSLSLTVQELTGMAEAEREAEVLLQIEAEAQQPFDLSRGPLLRVKLWRLSESEHVVLLTMHHIITDGWSMGVLINEVAALYRAFAAGEAVPLPELPVQYADFALWQRERLAGEELERQLSYWRQQLAEAPALLALPTDRPRPPVQTFNGAHEAFTLSAETLQGLQRLSRSRDVTLFMTLLAVWQVLLQRYSGQTDIVVGADVANRNRAETEGLIGFFVNMLVLRTNHAGDPTFLDLLKRVKEVCLGAYAHQDLPFEKLVEELQPERSLNHSPLFQVVFVLQNTPLGALELPGLVLNVLERERAEAQFDLILSMQEAEGELWGTLHYNTDLFAAETIKRMLGHLQTLLAAVVADPAQQLSTLPLLTEGEEQQLAEWNDTSREYPREAGIHQLFEAQVERTPEAVAVSVGEQEISYRELNRRANQVAHYLRSLGVGPEVCVGVCLERSMDLVVALVAILKAGGAYVPLDSSYPLERLAYMLEDARIGLLVTTEKMLEVLPAHWAQVVCLDTEAEMLASLSEENLASEVSAENLAYVMYTSGSTGQPKGVSVVQRSVVRLVKETNYLEIGERDVFLQSAPISFDASTLEVWGSLLNGARLVLLEQERPTLEELARAITGNGVTVLWLTAGLFHLMVEEQGAALLGVRRMLAGGDVLAVEQVRKYLAQMGADGRLINGYGPTENTTFTCCHTMDRDSHWAGSVPIGKPIANTTVYILDQQQRPAPVGVYGEVYAGGDGLARGYLNGPALTAEKFVPHPFSARGGERLYRTGDVGRWLNDGSIEFLGRVDEQVKLRGFRIELGEIEAALSRHAGVREAVVVVQEVNEDKRLVAYVVGEDSLASGALRQYLKGVLPEYMVPQAFVQIERLPLTTNGKVDRRALPAVEHVREETETEAAQTPVEEVLVGIWSEVLGVPVGVADDFFELGGHSLLATQVMSRVREVFGVEVGLRELFERPTVKELGQSIERELRQGAGVSAPPITSMARDRELPLSFAQQRLWFIDQMEPGSVFYNVPAAVRLQGHLQVDALARTFTEVLRRHEVLRTRFANVGGRAVQVVEEPGRIELPVVDLSELATDEREAEVSKLTKAEAEEPFDLSRGPLLRVKLLRLGEQEHVVLLTMHHIVMDGWSVRIFIREIVALYEAFIDGKPSPLEELPLQYTDFAAWQRAWLTGEVLEKQLAYWKEQMANAPAMLELPTDRPRPAVQTYRGATHSFAVRADVVAALKELSRCEDVTFFMTLLAAWKVLLARYTGQVDLLLGTPIANRNRRETEDLIGFFVNTLVLRTDLSGNPVFRELLRRVREVCLTAYAHQDLPFEKLVEELQPERSLNHTPLFQVSFALQNVPVDERSLPGLSLSLIQTGHVTSKFDLTLLMAEAAGELNGSLEYNSDLFDAVTIERLAEHFKNLLEAVVANPDQRILSLPVLSKLERERLISQPRRWNDAESQCLPQLFEAQVERTPEATALVHETQRVSYKELNDRANQLAHCLQRSGVGPESLVALYLDRSVEMVSAILAILKAGAAYLPLDLSWPAERVAFILKDAGASVLLTETQLLGQLPAGTDIALICLDTEQARIATESVENPVSSTQPENLAYVIYTSGSTGQPKGALITHTNVSRLFSATQDVFYFDERDVWTLFHSYAFDFSVWEIFGPLLTGGRLVVVPYLVSRAPAEFYELLRRERVTVLNQTPSAFRQLMVVDEQQQEPLALRLVIFGGEALELESLGGWFARHEERPELVNMYGITETTVHVTLREVTKTDVEQQAGSVIGRAIDDLQLYVLDGQMEPAPVGVAGELYVGGAGLARGYLKRSGLTAEKFVPHPFSARGGERLYRTGDVGRWLSDGSVEYRGRLDEQVKLRGFRIELGEIETALSRHPGVRAAVVVARDEGHDDKRLVAYIVPEPQYLSTLGEHVLHRLPNDLAVFHLNKNETEHLYREIFEDGAYLKHGLTLSDGDCVFDIGANIGLFTLFAAQRCKNLQTFAFEPSPVAFEKLRLNVERFGLQASLFACGLSNQEGQATFTYYPQASVMSGFYPNASEEKELFRSFMLNQPHAGGADEQALLSEYAEELTDGRFASERFNCQLRTISSIIAEYHLECVDLLKVDVEKSEADVLEGINEADWAKIKQVVVEVHDLEGRLNRVLSLLRKQGFEIAQEVLAAGTGVYNLYARRAQGNGFEAAPGQATSQSLRVVAHYTLSSGDLRRYLKETLPDYMVPASYVLLEKLPLTANGKVDRRALPAPQYSGNGLARDHAGPRTVTEEILANIWLAILGVEEIGIDDNFFELGGHSLLATQLMSRVREAFGVEVSLRELFERPTVKELGERIEQALGEGAGVAAPIVRADREQELPLSFAQQRLWFIDQLEPGRAFYNVPVAVRLKGHLQVEALARTFTEVLRRHEVLRTRFGTVSGRAVQVIEAAAPVELEVVDLSDLEIEEREARVREWSAQEAATPFDLSRGPILRVKLLRLGEQEHVVLLTMHHIVADGWSVGVLIKEVGALYAAYAVGQDSPLEELPIQYADFAVWQRAYLQGEVLEQQLAYWRKQLAGAETVLKLPTDKPRPTIYSYRGATHTFALPEAVTAPLHKLSQEQGCTLFMTLLASFKTLLYRYSEQEDILVGTAIANRNRSETEALIGFFVNTLVMRTDLSGNPSFRKLMQRVRETTLGAYVHQDMPFEKLVEELQPERSLSHAPLFQVAFGVHNTPLQTLTLPGLELSQMEFDFDAGRFDLTLWMSESEDELSGVWYYNTDLFEAATIKRMHGHFETILQNVLAQPDLPLSEIEMLTEDEKKQKILQKRERLESNAVVLRTIRRKGISVPPATGD